MLRQSGHTLIDLSLSLRRALDFPELVGRNAIASEFLEDPIRPVAIGRSYQVHNSNLQCAGMLYPKRSPDSFPIS